MSECPFEIGQKVWLNRKEIGVVTTDPVRGRHLMYNNDKNVWVHSPSKGFASYYATHNVEELPKGIKVHEEAHKIYRPYSRQRSNRRSNLILGCIAWGISLLALLALIGIELGVHFHGY